MVIQIIKPMKKIKGDDVENKHDGIENLLLGRKVKKSSMTRWHLKWENKERGGKAKGKQALLILGNETGPWISVNKKWCEMKANR